MMAARVRRPLVTALQRGATVSQPSKPKTTPPPTPAPAATVMMLCPHLRCRKILRVPQKCRGKQVKCHFCGNTFQVPADMKPTEPKDQDKTV